MNRIVAERRRFFGLICLPAKVSEFRRCAFPRRPDDLGLGLRPPVVSWGVLLNQAQNVKAVALHPWMLIPATFVIVTVLAFNLLGDGLRDAADPYAS